MRNSMPKIVLAAPGSGKTWWADRHADEWQDMDVWAKEQGLHDETWHQTPKSLEQQATHAHTTNNKAFYKRNAASKCRALPWCFFRTQLPGSWQPMPGFLVYPCQHGCAQWSAKSPGAKPCGLPSSLVGVVALKGFPCCLRGGVLGGVL